MRLYKVTAHVGIPAVTKTRWVGSQSDAASFRKELTDLGAKRKDIETEEVDVPTTKAELIEWLNTQEQANADA